jgi:hypothetical protein
MCFVCDEKKRGQQTYSENKTHKNESQKRERENQSIVITKQGLLLIKR